MLLFRNSVFIISVLAVVSLANDEKLFNACGTRRGFTETLRKICQSNREKREAVKSSLAGVTGNTEDVRHAAPTSDHIKDQLDFSQIQRYRPKTLDRFDNLPSMPERVETRHKAESGPKSVRDDDVPLEGRFLEACCRNFEPCIRQRGFIGIHRMLCGYAPTS